MSLKPLFICLLASTCFNAAVGMEEPKLQVASAPSQPKQFTTAQEMVNHGNVMLAAAGKKNWKLVEYLAYPAPVPAYTPISYSDVESYQYSRSSALHGYYRNLIDQNTLNLPLCIEYYKNIIQETAEYIEVFGSLQSKIASFNDRMIGHRYFIFDYYGQACFQLGAILKANQGSFDERLRYLKEAKGAYEKTLEHGKKLLNQMADDISLCESIQERLVNLHLSLISVIGSLVQMVPPLEEAPLVRQARNLRDQLKDGKQDEYFRKASETFVMIEKSLEVKRIESKPVGSKRVEAIYSQNYHKLQNEIIELKNSLFNDRNQKEIKVTNHLLDLIDSKQKVVTGLMILQESGWAEKVISGLIDIEAEIRKHLGGENKSSDLSAPEISLETVYENLSTLLGTDNLLDEYWKYLSSFMIARDLDGVIQRADILKNMALTWGHQKSDLYRFISAASKNLRGDHDEWLVFEEELEREAQLKKQRKKQAKEDAHQRQLELLQDHLAEQSRQEQQKKNEKKQNKPVVRPQILSDKNDIAQDSTESKLDYPQSIGIDDKQRMLEKHQRHEENEKKREKERKEADQKREVTSPVINEPRPLSKAEQRERILESSDKSLAELYELSSRSLEVDREIEGNTWRFTRGDFDIYITTMGCEYKSGKGVHTKASLPKATHITRGDTLITILNDFGGALTLPLWDKDYVPDYLKTQILEARKSLRALKILELKEISPD